MTCTHTCIAHTHSTTRMDLHVAHTRSNILAHIYTADPAVRIRRPTNLVCLVTYMSIMEMVSLCTHKQQDKRDCGRGGGGGLLMLTTELLWYYHTGTRCVSPYSLPSPPPICCSTGVLLPDGLSGPQRRFPPRPHHGGPRPDHRQRPFGPRPLDGFTSARRLRPSQPLEGGLQVPQCRTAWGGGVVLL